jgi:hypothetical protein
LPLPVIPSGCEGSGFEAIWSIPEGEGSRLFVILRSVFRDEGSRVGLFQIQKQVPRRSAPSGRQGQVVIPSGCEGSGFEASRNEKQVPRRSAPSGRQGQVVIPSGCEGSGFEASRNEKQVPRRSAPSGRHSKATADPGVFPPHTVS